MGRRHFKPEQLIHMLRGAEIKLAGGKKIGSICRCLHINGQRMAAYGQKQTSANCCQGTRLKVHAPET